MNQTSPLVYAITVNWNRPDDTIACVDSLLSQESITTKIMVVDNGSTDNSVSILRSKFPQIELISSPSNLKFGRGFNLGIRRALDAGAEYIFIINNDAILASNGLAILLHYANKDIGLLAPFIYDYENPDRIWSIGGKVHPWTLENINAARHIRIKDKWPPFFEQDFVTGCGMLFHRNILEEVGLFDEHFEQYYEDMDLCRRIRLAGFRILVITQAKMWHKIALSSGGSDTPDERYWMARSSVRYYRKHANARQLLVIIPYRLGSAFKTTLRLIVEKHRTSVRAYWKGLMDGLQDNIHPHMK